MIREFTPIQKYLLMTCSSNLFHKPEFLNQISEEYYKLYGTDMKSDWEEILKVWDNVFKVEEEK